MARRGKQEANGDGATRVSPPAGLTQRACDSARYRGGDGKRDVRWDGKVPGFGLRIFPSGVKSFVLHYRPQGSRAKRTYTIGKYGVYTVEQARARAKELLVGIANGEDPALEKKRAEPVSTFRELAERWMTDFAKPHRRSWKEDERRLDKHLLPRLGSMPVTSVTAEDVRPIHARIGKRSPIEANRVVELVRAIYMKGSAWSLVPHTHRNPTVGVDRFKERSRTRWLTDRELRRLFRALDREEPEIQAIVKLLLLTGARKRELLSARWDRIDLPAGRMRLVETKTGDERIVRLSGEAVELIRSLPRRLGSPFVFPNPLRSGEPLKDIKSPWERIRRRARLRDVKIHDLRRTTGSALVNAGVSLDAIAKALGHRDRKTTEIYARIAEEQAGAALATLGGMVAAVENTRKRARKA
jgi:integrase